MATSGTVGATVVDQTVLIEHACRRAGKLASSLTSEQQLAARESLFFVLSNLANRGINLWTVTEQILTLVPGQATYTLQVGTVDLLKGFYRTQSDATGTTLSTATSVGLDTGLGNSVTPSSIQVVFSGAGTSNLVVETSQDALSWTQIQTLPATTSIIGQATWFDLTNFSAVRAIRVRETVLGATLVGSIVVAFNPQEILAAKLNRDDFLLLPNKTFAGRSLQYWFDKQITPQIRLWPVPNDVTSSFVAWTTLHVQDPGQFFNTIQIPQRWYDGVIWILAMYLAMELPQIDPQRIQICANMGQTFLKLAEDGEVDGAPIKIDPGIRSYTR